jgi:hypothetical protein
MRLFLNLIEASPTSRDLMLESDYNKCNGMQVILLLLNLLVYIQRSTSIDLPSEDDEQSESNSNSSDTPRSSGEFMAYRKTGQFVSVSTDKEKSKEKD